MLKCAVVGLGWWGRQIAASLKGSNKLVLTHAVDAERVGAVAKELGLTLVTDYRAALQDPAVEAVILTTPNGLHEEQVLAAAEAGKQIFCEKPLALTAAGARRMVDACRARGLILGLGHERRYEPAMDEIRRLMAEGFFGTMLHAECHWSHNLFSAMADGGWRQDEGQSPAGALTTTGVHVVDLFVYFAGPVVEIYAKNLHRSDSYPGRDVLVVQYAFENGMTGVMTNLASTPFHCRFNLFGDGGWAEVVEISNMDIPDPATLTTRDRSGRLESRQYQPANIVRANLEEWADAVAGRAEYRFTDAEKVHGSEIFETILKSIKSGRPERLQRAS